MIRKIVYENASGQTCIVTPILNTREEPVVLRVVNGKPVTRPFTEADAEQRAMARLPVDAINPHFVQPDAIPADRTFRNAWKPDLTVDLDKAREIHKDKLRRLRAPLLAQLDVEFQRADEAKDEVLKLEIISQKEALRDVTDDPEIASAKTPDELKAVMPSVLLPTEV